MSDISGGQSTGSTELFVKVDGEASKGFLDIVKTLQDLGAYVESSVELLGRFEDKINNIGIAADNINKKTRKYSTKSAVQIGKNKKAVTVLNDVPTDASTPAGREGIQMLRSQKQLIDAQKALTEALEDATKASIVSNEMRAKAMALNADTKALGEPSRIRTRNTWSDTMEETRSYRNARNAFESRLLANGYKDREYEQKETLRKQRIESGSYFADRRNYDGFNLQEIFKSYIRQQNNRVLNSNTTSSAFGKIGSLIAPREVLQKKTASGNLLKGTGVSLGGLIGGVAADGIGKLVGAIDKLAHTSLAAYGTISKLETSLGVVYGSQSQAESVFDEIAEYAVQSPFGVEKLTEMAVLLKQSGIYESDLIDTLKTIGDLAGGNEEKYRRIANNYAQVLAIGKATTKDMREFANAGIPIFDATADYLGVSRKNLSSEIEAGNITAQVLEGVFKQLTSEGGIFYQATQKNAETYAARRTNLEDTKQLALSQVGENLYTGAWFGSYGETSFAKQFLDIEEQAFNAVKTVAENSHNKKALKAYEKNTEQIENLTKQLDKLLTEGQYSEEYIQSVRDEKKKKEETFSDDESIKILSNAYDDVMKKTNGQTEYDVQELLLQREDLEAELEKIKEQIVFAYKSGDEEDYLKLSGEQNKLNEEIAILNLNIKDVNKNLTKISSDMIYGKAFTMLESASRQMADALTKSHNNNQSSVSNLNATLEDLYKNTDAYKEEQKKMTDEIISQSNAQKQTAAKYGLGEDNINFLKKNTLTVDEFNKILDEFFIGESIFNEKKITSSNISQMIRNIEALQSLYTTEGSAEKTFLDKLHGYLNNKQPVADNAKAMEGANKYIIENLEGPLSDLVNKILVEYKYQPPSDKTDAVAEQQKKEKSEKFYPLWAKIAGDIFDTNPLKLEWTTFQSTDAIKKDSIHHGYGLQTYIDASYDNPKYSKEKDFRGSMMSRNGVEAILRASGTKYFDNLVFADEHIKNSNGVRQYDWDKSFKNLEKIALSLNSTTEVTSSLADYYKTEREKFTSYAVEGIVAKEDWADLMNKEYTDEMGLAGEAFDQLKNALSAEYTVLEDGTIQLTHAGMQIALEMEKMLEPMEILTGQFNTLKQSIAGVITSTEQTNLKSYAVRNQLFGQGLSLDQQASLANTAYSVISEELNKLGLDEVQRKAYLEQSTDFISRAVSGNTEGLNSTGIALVEAIQKMIEATKDNTSALINFELSKKLAGINNGEGDLSVDWKNLKFGQVDSLGNSIKQQGILENLGLSGYSYDQVIKAIDEDSGLMSGIKNALENNGIDTLNMSLDEMLEKWSLITESEQQFAAALGSLASGGLQALNQFTSNGLVSTFEEWGKSLVTASDASDEIGKAWGDLGKNLLSQMGPMMISAGLQSIIFSHGDKGMWITGLALIAAGGATSFLSGLFSAEDDSDKAEDEVQKLKSIKDMLADLLAQARIDAEYYEKNLRHQYAISANEELTRQSVNDAIITPKGDIISTHPDDWLIATKTPHDLVGSSAPVVTITIVNESGNTVQVARTEQQRNGNNIDVKAVVVAVMNEAMSDGSLDAGMSAYQQRQRGRTVSY